MLWSFFCFYGFSAPADFKFLIQMSKNIKLKIRYENSYQTIELDSTATKQLWVSLSLEGEGLSQKEREQRIQEEWEKKFNRPEYNYRHRETRHIDPTPKRKRMDGRSGYIQGDPDDVSFNVFDYLLTADDAKILDGRSEYEEVCAKVRKILEKKPEWVDTFIPVRLDGESIRSQK